MSEQSFLPRGGLSPNFKLDAKIQADMANIDMFELPKAAEAAQRLFEDINHDDLTGLLSKKAWRKKLEEALQEGGDKAVIFIDLTNFKKVNDESPGRHQAGDFVLQEVGKVLKRSVRLEDNDTVSHERRYAPNGDAGRLGGDEFAILLDLTPRTEEWKQKSLAERMRTVIDRLNDDFATIKTKNPELPASFDVALGGAVWEPGMDIATLLNNADHAMGENKADQHAANGKYRP